MIGATVREVAAKPTRAGADHRQQDRRLRGCSPEWRRRPCLPRSRRLTTRKRARSVVAVLVSAGSRLASGRDPRPVITLHDAFAQRASARTSPHTRSRSCQPSGRRPAQVTRARTSIPSRKLVDHAAAAHRRAGHRPPCRAAGLVLARADSAGTDIRKRGCLGSYLRPRCGDPLCRGRTRANATSRTRPGEGSILGAVSTLRPPTASSRSHESVWSFRGDRMAWRPGLPFALPRRAAPQCDTTGVRACRRH